ncbi:MAG: glycosyltransferase [Acidobacteriota bacterium]
MRVALVHDFLVQFGGAERVLEAFCSLFPDAPIFTLFYDEARTRGRFRGREIRTSHLNRLPVVGPRIGVNHHLFFWSFPGAIERLDLSGFDLVLSSSSSYAKGVRVPAGVPHVCYCHTPTRYLWEDVRKYVRGWLASAPARLLGESLFVIMRRWDYDAAQRPARIIANSRFIADRIRRFYGRGAQAVIHPPVDTDRYSPNGQPSEREQAPFLMVGRMLPYKRFDLGIEACNRLGLPLVVVGVGREADRLKASAGPTVHFRGWVSEAELPNVYRSARALIFPQVEDFGLVAAEAVACGTPVIAFRRGGALDIVEEGRNGLLFEAQDVSALTEALRRFNGMAFEPREVAMTAQRFNACRFKEQILEALRWP